jgi:inhibitor of KinA sporulation pathway (predicted exonuclease)
MDASMSKILFVDIEMTCGYDPDLVSDEVRESEIIEFGVVEVDTFELVVTRQASYFVKPKLGHITQYCTDLTGITQEDVDSGLSLEKTAKLIRNAFGTKSKVWYAWGDDERQIRNEFGKKNIPYPFGYKHIDLMHVFSHMFGMRGKRGLQGAVKDLRLEEFGTAHRALDDAMNTANIWMALARTLRDNS